MGAVSMDTTANGAPDAEITEAELQDFLAADYEPVEADPDFRSRLRDDLWSMIQENELSRH